MRRKVAICRWDRRTLRGNWVEKFYNDGLVQAVTFAYLIYWWVSCLLSLTRRVLYDICSLARGSHRDAEFILSCSAQVCRPISLSNTVYCRAMLCISAAYAVMRCLFVCACTCVCIYLCVKCWVHSVQFVCKVFVNIRTEGNSNNHDIIIIIYYYYYY